ncbi:MAG: hypothetical protein ACXQT3_04300 [Methermicoccaceae archaeon]
MSILCRLGFHRWRQTGKQWDTSSNVVELTYVCTRCGRVRRQFKPYTRDLRR